MPDTVVLQATVDVELDRELDRLASESGIGKSDLIQGMLREFVTAEPDYPAFVEKGLTDLREGRWKTHEEVVARFEARYGSAR